LTDEGQTHYFPKATIFVFTFLALYVILIATMPAEFFYPFTASGSTYDYSFLSFDDIKNIRFLETVNITRPALFLNDEWFDFTAEINFKMRVTWESTNRIWFEHMTWEFLGFQQFDQMKIMEYNVIYGSAQHFILLKEHVIANWDSEYNASILTPVQCDHVSTKVWVMDTNTSRNDIEQAWDDGALTISMGFGFSDYETKMSAIDILGRLLLFQAPTIFGLTGDMATIINVILTVPFYAMVGTLIFLVAMMIIPF